MEQLYAYTLLNSLTIALFHSLWQAAILWLIYQAINLLIFLSNSSKYRLLTFMQVVSFTWFIATIFNAATDSYQIGNNNLVSYITNNVLTKIFPFVSLIYLFFALVFIAKIFIQITQTNYLIIQYQNTLSSKWNDYVKQAATQLGITKNIVLKTTNQSIIPFTIGFLKPVIVVPIAAINNLSAQELEAVLLHELAHIKRYDYVVNIGLLFIEAVLFFNPFSKLINKEIFELRELCCDDLVLQNTSSSKNYAQALLNIAKINSTNNSFFTALTVIPANHQLTNRIKRILKIDDATKNNYSKKHLIFAFSFGSLIFLLVGFINANVKQMINSTPTLTASSLDVNRNIFFTKNIATSKIIAHFDKNVNNKTNLKKHKTAVANATTNEQNNRQFALENNRQFVANGFKELAKNICSNNENIATRNSEFAIVDSINNIPNYEITAAVEKQSTTTTQRFIVPATTESAASIIIVTTTLKADGKKQVKIEIEKGNSKIE